MERRRNLRPTLHHPGKSAPLRLSLGTEDPALAALIKEKVEHLASLSDPQLLGLELPANFLETLPAAATADSAPPPPVKTKGVPIHHALSTYYLHIKESNHPRWISAKLKALSALFSTKLVASVLTLDSALSQWLLCGPFRQHATGSLSCGADTFDQAQLGQLRQIPGCGSFGHLEDLLEFGITDLAVLLEVMNARHLPLVGLELGEPIFGQPLPPESDGELVAVPGEVRLGQAGGLALAQNVQHAGAGWQPDNCYSLRRPPPNRTVIFPGSK